MTIHILCYICRVYW